MAIGLGIGPAFKKGFSWSSYWTQQSLFFLDGTIITVGENKYFEDKSAADRHFLITGYDFASDWTTGFPYKSAATISAPAADAALIAADINNFLYDAGGTPNQIPVVSLFQDIDYEHKIFCKHVAQTVDAEGVELTEPYVSHMFMATDALSGADLTKAYTDFSVPTEEAAYNWVTKAGQDAAARGTKAAPWLTTQYGENNASAEANVYVKTGEYAEYDTSFNYVMYNKKINFHAIGRMKLDNSHESYLGYLLRIHTQGETSIKRFIFDTDKVYTGAVVSIEGTAEIIDTCKINGRASAAIIGTPAAGVYTIRNSILIVTAGTQVLGFASAGTLNFENNYVYKALGTYVINSYTGAIELNIKNNKISGVWTTACIRAAGPGQKNIIGNTINLTSTSSKSIFSADAAADTSLLIRGNKVNISVVPDSDVVAYLASVLTSIKFDRNTFTIGAITKTAISILRIINNDAIEVTDNVFDVSLTGTIYPIRIESTGTDIDNSIISGNAIRLRVGTGGYPIIIGGDASSAGDNHCNNVTVRRNAIYGQNYNDTTPANVSTHAILYGFSKGLITQNYVNGVGPGCVSKSEATDGSDITYNIVIDTIWALYVKGADACKIYNNFFRNTRLTSSIGVYVIPNTTTAPSGIEVKNNILINDIDNANNWLINIHVDSLDTLVSDYNVFYTKRADGKIISVSDGNTYTLTEWQALGFDAHSVVLTDGQLASQFPTGQYYPTTPIIGEVLDAAYDEGLDVATNWGNDETAPSVVVKDQAATWQIGAYIV